MGRFAPKNSRAAPSGVRCQGWGSSRTATASTINKYASISEPRRELLFSRSEGSPVNRVVLSGSTASSPHFFGFTGGADFIVAQHEPTPGELVYLTSPIDLRAQIAAHPEKRANQIAQRIQPSAAKRPAVTCGEPSCGNRLNHAIKEGCGKNDPAKHLVAARQARDTAENTVRHGVRKDRPKVSLGTGETCAPHPAHLVAHRGQKRMMEHHMVDAVMGEHDLHAGLRDSIAQDVIVRAIISHKSEATKRLEALATHDHGRAQGKFHALEHVGYDDASRHFHRKSKRLEFCPEATRRQAAVHTRRHTHVGANEGLKYVAQIIRRDTH